MNAVNNPNAIRIATDFTRILWIAIDVILVITYGNYLRRRLLSATGAYRRPEVQASIGLATYFLGVLCIRVWNYVAFYPNVFGYYILYTARIGALAGDAISVIGALIVVSVFAKNKNTWWIGMLAASLASAATFVLMAPN